LQKYRLSLMQQMAETEQSGWLQNDGGTEDTCRLHKKSAPTGDDTIRGSQVRSALSASIQDAQLMFDQHRLCNDGTETARSSQSGQSHDQINENAGDVAHPEILPKPLKPAEIGPIH
jgi:hypothetical protein